MSFCQGLAVRVTEPAVPPRVSFIICAFDQERFIGEAIAGALAQTYPNLEIILSDDCSNDRTYALIEKAAANYRGPHLVRARRNAVNLGLWGHFMTAFREAEGELIVVAAGDDISLPGRTQRLVEEWQASGAAALSSAWLEMDDQSRLLNTGVKQPCAPANVVWQYFIDKRDRPFVSGQSAAYSRRFLARLPDTDERISHEDSLLTTLATAWQLPIRLVHEPLLHYRVHPASYRKQLIRDVGYEKTLAETLRASRYARANGSYLAYALDLLRADPPPDDGDAAIDWSTAEQILALSVVEGAYTLPGLRDRLSLLTGAPTRRLQLMAAQRLLPLRAFALVKHLLGRA